MDTTTGEITGSGNAALFKKMAGVMAKMNRVKKTGKHPTQGYPFATDADVSDMVREAMAEEGLVLLPSFASIEQNKVGTTKYGQDIIRTTATFIFTLACADTGATYSCTWKSEADDSSDKGINKTATAALKYFLLKTFIISTGDTVDADASPDIEHAAPMQANGAQPAKPDTEAIRQKLGTDGKPRVIGRDSAPEKPEQKVTWDTPDILAKFLDKCRRELNMPDMTASEVARLAQVGAFEDLTDWRIYDNPYTAFDAVKIAFERGLEEKPAKAKKTA